MNKKQRFAIYCNAALFAVLGFYTGNWGECAMIVTVGCIYSVNSWKDWEEKE